MANKFTVQASIICDDVRVEDNRKQILIGVYGGDFILNKIPATLTFCFWIELVARERGNHPLEFSIQVPGTEERVEAGASINDPSEPTILIFRTTLLIQKTGEFKLSMREGKAKWRTLSVRPGGLRVI